MGRLDKSGICSFHSRMELFQHVSMSEVLTLEEEGVVHE